MTRAMLNAGQFVSVGHDAAIYALPNDMTRAKCEERHGEAEAALTAALGRPMKLQLVVDQEPSAPLPVDPGVGAGGSGSSARDADTHLDDHEDIDVSELRDAPPVPVTSPIDTVLSAFPGAELVDE